MKDFRSGTLATPGVIAKVSKLFQGKPNLIIGFRKFLPAGYTIELTAEDQKLFEQQQVSGASRGGAAPGQAPAPAQAGGQMTTGPPRPVPAAQGAPRPAQPGQAGPGGAAGGAPRPGAPPVQRANPPPRTGPGNGQAQGGGTGSLELPHAIQYVTKIKKRFADDPATYKAFLETLHGYQKQVKSIADVLDKVSELFKDHPDLLRDFTFFLPDSVQDKARERINRSVAEYESRHGRPAPLSNAPRPGDMAYSNNLGYAPGTQQMAGPGAQGGMQGGMGGMGMQPRPYGQQGGMVQAGPGGVVMGGPRGPYAMAGAPPAGWGTGGVGMAGMAARGMQPPPSQQAYAQAYGAQAAAETQRRMEQDAAMSARERERERERERMLDRARDRAQLGMGPGKSARVQAVLRRRRAQALEMEVQLTPTERTFFDRIRSALGPEGWVEFLKILELFSLDVLTKAELFMLVKDLFSSLNVQHVPGYLQSVAGGQGGLDENGQPIGAPGSGTKLLDEFKGILTNKATLEVTPQDLWYSMPATEIDLSQQVRCTPSYRRLPAGWPKLSCTLRSREEAAMLNDLWVSVPTGSEDVSFKNPRKNQFEDALFLCEDARHEVDMVIENNAAAIRVLVPLQAEIDALRSVQPSSTDWQFRLDSRSLGVMHLRAIARVYGEYGAEVLELLRKNPAGAIAIILKRLQQKDAEWREARAQLNVGWKEIMEKNYYKSLDHRSFYFKTVDKKATSAKPLIAEIKSKAEAIVDMILKFKAAQAEADAEKARASATGNAAIAAAAATEGGTQMDVDGASKGGAGAGGEDKKAGKDDKAGPKAVPTSITAERIAEGLQLPRSIRSKLRSSEPVLHFMYRDTSVHQDAYRLLQYAVEKTIPQGDKPAIAQLWRTFLAPFFRFPPEWSAPTSLAAYPHGFGQPDSRTLSGQGLPPSAVLQVGEAVSTPLGDGIIADVRLGGLSEQDAVEQASKRASSGTGGDVDMEGTVAAPGPLMYEVWLLPWGRAYMNPSSVKIAKVVPGSARAMATAGGTSSGSAGDAHVPLMTSITTGVAQPLVTAGAGKIPLSEFAKLRQGKVKPTLTSTGAAGAVASTSGADAGQQAGVGTHDVSQAGGALINGTHYIVASPPPPGSVFYATQNAYVFFRLHQYVCDRLTTARLLCARGRQLRQKDSKALKHPADRKAEGQTATPVPGQVAAVMGTAATAVAQAAGPAAAREAAAHTGSTGASVAASHGDLTDVAAAAVHAIGGDISAPVGAGISVQAVQAEETYQAFLTALYGAIDGSMDPSKYEDDCRDLMGTSAYLLFTLDRLCVSAAKQLQGVVKESTTPGLTQKLIQHWMYAQAKVAYAVHKAASTAEGKYTGTCMPALYCASTCSPSLSALPSPLPPLPMQRRQQQARPCQPTGSLSALS